MKAMTPFRLAPLLLGGLMLVATPSPAQVTEQQALQAIQQNPELVRQRLQQSGMSAEQIRQRLQSAGYSPSLLDQFLGSEPVPTGVMLSDQQLQALTSLGVVGALQAQGLERVLVDTGLVRREYLVEQPDTGLRVFGIEAFRSRTTQFQPVLSGPVPSSYKVGPGDVMVLVITGDVEFIHELSVTREGFIVIPQVGQIYVNSLTMEQLNQLLRQRLGRSYSGIRTGTTRFDVTISRLRTNQIYVNGEVVQPGAYQLASVATVLNALYAAGGPTRRGNFRSIQVLRAGDTASTLDLYDYLMNGAASADIILEQGDVVFVPLRGDRVAVTGAVLRPAYYELKPNQTLADVVTMAGGFRAEAELKRLLVHRVLPPVARGAGASPRAVIEVPLGATAGPGRRAAVPALPLQDGDSVVVEGILPPDRTLYVTISGAVNHPDQFPWREGMTLRDLVRLARGPAIGADLRQAEVASLPPDRARGDLARAVRVPMDSSFLMERDSAGRYLGPAGLTFPPAGSAPLVALQPFDQVTIFRQPEFEFQRLVEVRGEVNHPGTYALVRKDERVSDLIRRAGGLLPTAYPGGARFVRQFRNAGRVNIDLAVALGSPGAAQDVILQPGDSLLVPEYNPTVQVQGAVVAATSVLYREGAGLDYYVDNAGGYARNADKGRVSVRYANGTAQVKRGHLFLASVPKPGPGSVITVATSPEPEPFRPTEFLGHVAQILASLVAIVVLATR